MSSTLLKFGLPAMGAVGSAGIGYGVYSHTSKQNRTLRDLVEGVSLISDSRSKNWETIFEDLKNSDEDLVQVLSSINPKISKTSKNVEAAPILNGWCEKTLNLKEGVANQSDLLSKIKKWCVVQPLTISDKLKDKNLSVISSGWEDKYEKLKESIFDEIKSKGESFTSKDDKTKGGTALQKWCTESIGKGTHEEDASKLFTKVKDRCTGT
ncbi:hypothetical protein HF1_08640 [Mycoplasma haemofelis str. Langford 1]|uniref:Uncharacterized protein n=2 Tax=Mycoplasma haemofelis TaxID=29501 RepID=F6FJ02_MYCHI|nr:hypothetical protein [Mycoplasma haemofelis]AEG73200.1 hypothetical protein MHF_0943 [Mycoplasma haemofelis Ohio2]CBY92872.1 hypothetical protein HF1_08640 [Mycoplasma haemofelis str. Langford 1]